MVDARRADGPLTGALAFVVIGEFVGYSGIVSFSIAIGRRLREILVGIPAIVVWYVSFKSKLFN